MQTNRENIILLPWWGETSPVELTVSVDQERSRVRISVIAQDWIQKVRSRDHSPDWERLGNVPELPGSMEGAAELQGGTWDVSFDAMGSQWSGGLWRDANTM